MKKTSLVLNIPLLFAGGCSQEPTELERCIEVEYDETDFLYELHNLGWCKTSLEGGTDEWKEKFDSPLECVEVYRKQKKRNAKEYCHSKGIY